MIIRVNNIGAIGIIKDLPPHELPPEAWTDGSNMRFEGGFAEKIYGNDVIYNITVSAATAVQGLAESPWFVQGVQAGNSHFYLYAGQKFVFAADTLGNSYPLNKTVGGTTFTYCATPSIRWNGGVLSGLAIINNSIDPPQVWLSAGATQRLADLQWDASAGVGWGSRTGGAVTAKVLRTYREFGVAMNTTEGASVYPRRVRWSHPATPGNPPETWDEARDDKDAGYWDLDETTDSVIDGLQLRDLFVIYKERSTWAMQWTGGQYVHQFRQLFPSFGIMSANCVVEVNGTHIVLTDNDVVRHDGQSVQSIIEDKFREFLFANIATDYYSNCFLVKNVEENEVWVCFPESGAAEPYWCTKALIWNWLTNAWSIRDLPKVSHITVGKTDFVVGGGSSYTWASFPGTWGAANEAWGGVPSGLLQREMIGAYPEDMSATGSSTYTVSQPGNTAKLLKMNSTNQFLGQNFTSYLIREGLSLAGRDRFGNPKVDLHNFKYVRRVWPHIHAADGTVIMIRVGTQKHPTDTVTWSAPYTYTVGTDEYINCRVMGRLISVWFSNTDSNHWVLSGYDLDVDQAGMY